MKITKYPQSCLVVEQNGKRIVIDPGSFVAEKYVAKQLAPVDAILITHEHADHANPDLIRALTQLPTLPPVVANQGTASVLGGLVTQVVADGETLQIAGMQVVARELPHCLSPDGSPGPQNTGYVIDGAFFHPGDGISMEGLTVNAAAIPIAGPDISAKDVFAFIKQLGCKTVIPIHYNYYLENPQLIAQVATSVVPSVRLLVLEDGQSVEV